MQTLINNKLNFVLLLAAAVHSKILLVQRQQCQHKIYRHFLNIFVLYDSNTSIASKNKTKLIIYTISRTITRFI